MVQHFTSLEGLNLRNTWLTIGSFDGIHIGHQKLIHDLNSQAHKAEAISAVLTFHPHPAVVLKGRTGAFYLTTPTEKVKLLDGLGTDVVITHPFTHELSQSTAHDYVTYLLNHLGFKELWVGYDFALGKGREGNVSLLKVLGEELGYQVHVGDPIMSDGRIVSSSQIRNLLIEGSIHDATKLLGRFYRVAGEVVHGDGRGKLIGIPTANLDTGPEKLVPGAGVYACQVQIQDVLLPAAVNVGTRPTFENTDKLSHLEAHVLNYSGDLYTQTIAVDFVERLRGEERFDSVDDLIRQIFTDIEQTRDIIANEKKT